ncbi:MAG TPA: phosphoglucosamine mutase [Actinomycetota bacterium]|nr:phosphoglucosamine mutase [Actinomycetota bacterium]
MGRLFGTDGVRGVAGSELTAALARGLGRAAVAVLARGGPHRPVLLLGRDPRESGIWLEEALVAGIHEAGGDVLLAGVEPTPAIAFLTIDAGADAGVVISASHNPPEYNGIKFFGSNGMKLPDAVEDEIEAALEDPWSAASGGGGSIGPLEGGRERYLAHLERAAGARLDGMTIVVDCANGAASGSAPALYRRLGATVHAIHAEPDGRNINVACGALHPEVAGAAVVELGADAGVSHDGDADRALFVDHLGTTIDGDQVLAACAVAMKADGALANDGVVTTLMANLGFHRAMMEAGITVFATKVGDRYVLEEMLEEGVMLGGEQSGHLIFREYATTGDGLLTAVRFLSLAARQGRTVAELASVMRRYPQVMANVRVRSLAELDGSAAVWDAVRAAEHDLAEHGRVLVRASGTEPLVRVMVEAETEDGARRHAENIAGEVRKHLGV